MSKQAERNTAVFRAVYDAVQTGAKLNDAIAAAGVSPGGYWQWRQRNGLDHTRVKPVPAPAAPPAPSAAFKAAEREYRALPTLHEICAKHGITRRQLYSWRYLTGGLPK